MAQKQSYTVANRYVSRFLSVRYKTQPREVGYAVTRYATKSYAYVGMTKTAAKECRDAMRALYTRRRVSIGDDNRDVYVTVCMADISLTKDSGQSFTVQVNVNETDARFSADIPSDPATLFAIENERDYEEARMIEIVSALADGESRTEVSYLTSISDFEYSRLVLEYKNNDTAQAWTVLAPLDGVSVPNRLVVGASLDGRLVRLSYGSLKSNIVTAQEGLE